VKAGERPIGHLMALAQAGDAEAYRAVLTWSRAWLLRYFSRRIAPSLVDDLVQETLVSIHAKRATYDPARPFLPWLAAIARYRWVDQLRRDYRDGGARVEEEIAWDGDVESEVTARISIDRMLAKLPPGQSQAIRLVKIDGLSVAEASIRANQSESLIKVNIHRGLKRLAAEIGRE
jgi:RNA polymerase sigma factor (sigma-70 family)